MSRLYILFPLIIIISVGIITYSNSLSGSFVFDDASVVVENAAIRDPGNPNAIWHNRPTRFLTYLSYAFNYKWGALQPIGYHLVNVLVHISNAILVFFFVQSLIGIIQPASKNNRFSVHLHPLFISLLFVSHPIQTQAVSYISQRSGLLSALFYLSSLYLYVKSVLIVEKIKGGLSRWKFRIVYFLSLLFALFSYLAKENSFTLPLSIILLDLVILKRVSGGIKKRIPLIVPYFLFAAIVLYITLLISWKVPVAQISNVITFGASKPISPISYFATELHVIPVYIRLLLFPKNLNADPYFPLVTTLFTIPTIVLLLFLISLVCIAFRLRKTFPFISLGVLFFFLTLSVESSFFPIEDVIFEHRVYLPSVGFFLALTTLFFSLAKSDLAKKIGYGFLIMLILLLSFLTYKRNFVWQSEYALWSDTVTKSPNKARPHYNLAVASFAEGEQGQAIKEFEITIFLDPANAAAYLNLGAIAQKKLQADKAEEYYKKAYALEPKNQIIRTTYAIFLISQKRDDEARKVMVGN